MGTAAGGSGVRDGGPGDGSASMRNFKKKMITEAGTGIGLTAPVRIRLRLGCTSEATQKHVPIMTKLIVKLTINRIKIIFTSLIGHVVIFS